MMHETRRCTRTMETATSLNQITTTTMQAQQAPEMKPQTRRCARTMERCTSLNKIATMYQPRRCTRPRE